MPKGWWIGVLVGLQAFAATAVGVRFEAVAEDRGLKPGEENEAEIAEGRPPATHSRYT